ncbi:MarR family winged helix-turn-helix transcriptional regulator [Allostreptomyces psammosilenae]|uniref:DNA-binding MarR family transcriptional regulator n=1 Tax=Allostreptomyces psammosilenae TaxID=1892865 RepID=A0A852ZZY5_9ACTN|nr:MarR family transcriptional regulator [Allostreptomyces psammosilenae]NYI07709.1 DNA-binding MarR family transcriptional regulator [Allostreptomyces psammosilenae]
MPELSQDDLAAVTTLRASVLRLGRRLRNERVDESLSVTELSVLGWLVRCGPATPGELARREHVQPPSMTRIVAMLEVKGLVRRDPHPEDRRQVVVTATDQAEAMVLESRRRRDAWLAGRVESLSEEEWAALRVAAPVLERLADL